ncbi:MAG: hypothetical protein V3R16_02600 [Nitrospirales bacterium]
MTEKFWIWLVWKLPRDLVYWCAIRAGAAATTPPYGHQLVPDLTFMQALKRWERNRKPDDFLLTEEL